MGALKNTHTRLAFENAGKNAGGERTSTRVSCVRVNDEKEDADVQIWPTLKGVATALPSRVDGRVGRPGALELPSSGVASLRRQVGAGESLLVLLLVRPLDLSLATRRRRPRLDGRRPGGAAGPSGREGG